MNIGDSQKFTITHQNSNNTITTTANHRLAFGDAGEYISGDGADLKIISSGNIDIAATLVDITGALTTSGRVQIDDNTEATSITDGSLQTDGGLSVTKSAVVGVDLDLLSDTAILNFGTSNPVSLSHISSAGLLLSGHNKLQFNDSAVHISCDQPNYMD